MALVEFQNLPSTSTPLNASNLNNNFNECGKEYTYSTSIINGGNIYFHRKGRIVEVWYNGDISSAPAGSFDILNSFPSEYRPGDSKRISVHRSVPYDVEIFFNTDGTITAYNYSSAITTASNFQFSIMYIL